MGGSEFMTLQQQTICAHAQIWDCGLVRDIYGVYISSIGSEFISKQTIYHRLICILIVWDEYFVYVLMMK